MREKKEKKKLLMRKRRKEIRSFAKERSARHQLDKIKNSEGKAATRPKKGRKKKGRMGRWEEGKERARCFVG